MYLKINLETSKGNLFKSDCLSFLRTWFQFRAKKSEKISISAPFEADIKFIFEGFHDEIEKCTIFSNSVRSLLVDNIFKNLRFDPQKEDQIYEDDFEEDEDEPSTYRLLNIMRISKLTKKILLKNIELGFKNKQNNSIMIHAGLPFMLSKKYFDDAFILHEELNGYEQFNEILTRLIQDGAQNDTLEMAKQIEQNEQNILPHYKNKDLIDSRSKLDNIWAGFTNIFKYQPLEKVRDYFGEYIAFYFSFTGHLISSLWVLALIGVAFFTISVTNK